MDCGEGRSETCWGNLQWVQHEVGTPARVMNRQLRSQTHATLENEVNESKWVQGWRARSIQSCSSLHIHYICIIYIVYNRYESESEHMMFCTPEVGQVASLALLAMIFNGESSQQLLVEKRRTDKST